MFGKKISEHTGDYLILVGLLAVAGLMVKFFGVSRPSMILVTVITAMGYVLWGILHHKKAGHIDNKIILEYVGFALLVVIIVFSLVT